MAQASYCVAPNSTWTCPSCVDGADVFDVIDADGGRAVIGYDAKDKTVFASFRGSENIENWIDNLEFVKYHPWESFPLAGVERGFYEWYLSLRNAGLLEALGDACAKHGTKTVKTQGHSAGSAPAVFLAFETLKGVARANFSVVNVTTFGSPRLGDEHFVALYNATNVVNTRVTHDRDIVPHLPLDDMFWLGYAHVPTEVFYDAESTTATVCDGSGEDQNCSDKCTLCNSIADHLYYLNTSVGSLEC